MKRKSKKVQRAQPLRAVVANKRSAKHPTRSGTKDQPAQIPPIECQTAEELLAALDPIGANLEVWSDPMAWVFRGQSDSTQSLLPSALRPDVYLLRRGAWTSIEKLPLQRQIELEQLRGEVETLQRFYTIADSIGLPVPENSAAFRAKLEQLRKKFSSTKNEVIEWPPDWLLPLLGICQHYGMPTRLLDWTRCPFTACYFAAVGAAPHSPQAPSIAVTACSRSLCIDTGQEQALSSGQLRFVTVPSAGNKNLQAQRGLFSVFTRRPVPLMNRIDRKTFDDLLLATVTPGQRQRIQSPDRQARLESGFVRFTLCSSESPKLLRLVSRYDVSGSSLFPGFDGVWRGIRETQSWDKLYVVHSEEVRQPRSGKAH